MQPQQPPDGANQNAQPPSPAERSRAQPVEGFLRTALDSIKAMVDVNTILGVPVQAPDGTVIIPVSRVSFGFVAGGSEFEGDGREQPRTAFPFGGATGAGVSLSPVAFLVVHQGQVRLLPVSERALYDRLLDLVPWVAERLRQAAPAPGAAPDGAAATGPAGRPPASARQGAAGAGGFAGAPD
ncbi:MAG TPA: GerW family sporulation protein [Limnochordales bacterium]